MTKFRKVSLCLGLVFFLAVSLCTSGCNNSNGFCCNSMKSLNKGFKGYWARERTQSAATEAQVKSYIDDEKYKIRIFKDKISPAWDTQKNDWRNLKKTWNEFVQAQ